MDQIANETRIAVQARTKSGFARPMGHMLAKRVNPTWGIIGGVILLTLSLWVALFVYLDFEKRSAYANARQLAGNFARTFEEHTIRTVRGIDQTTQYIKREYERLGSRLKLDSYVNQGIVLDTFFNLIAIAGPDGWLVTTDRPVPQSNIADREHFQVHVKEDTGKLFISKPVLGRSSGRWSIQFTRRLNKPDGSFNGIVVASVDPNYFSDFYNSVELGEWSVAELVGTDGIVRARQNARGSVGKTDFSKRELLDLPSGEKGNYVATSQVDGATRLYSYRRLRDYPLMIVVGIGENEILADYGEHRRVLITVGVVVTVLLLVAGAAVVSLFRYQAGVQDALRRSEQEAVSASRTKSEFLARMSHELRTPLNGILGFSEFLRDNLENPDHRKYAETILQAGQHLLMMVNATLDLARIEAGRMEIKPGNVELRPLAEQIIATHLPVAEKKGLFIKAEFGADLPLKLRCDSAKLRQILNNLVNNAIKFTDDGGVTVRIERDDGSIRFSVTDTGRGIPEDQWSSVFDHFRQLDSFDTRTHEGSGLGLALARQLVILLGGRIWLASSPDQGTTFFVLLPIEQPHSSTVSL